jgi:hypothetical protein
MSTLRSTQNNCVCHLIYGFDSFDCAGLVTGKGEPHCSVYGLGFVCPVIIHQVLQHQVGVPGEILHQGEVFNASRDICCRRGGNMASLNFKMASLIWLEQNLIITGGSLLLSGPSLSTL